MLHRDTLGGLATVTISGRLTPADHRAAAAANLEIAPVSFQQLIVDLSTRPEPAPAAASVVYE